MTLSQTTIRYHLPTAIFLNKKEKLKDLGIYHNLAITNSTKTFISLNRPQFLTMQSRNPSPLPTTHPSTWPLLLLLLLVYMAQALYTLPLNRVIELRLCQEHYAQQDPSVILHDGSIPEKLCKVDEVQRRLAWLQGIMETTVVFFGWWWWRGCDGMES
jgi:hypothetical protein